MEKAKTDKTEAISGNSAMENQSKTDNSESSVSNGALPAPILIIGPSGANVTKALQKLMDNEANSDLEAIDVSTLPPKDRDDWALQGIKVISQYDVIALGWSSNSKSLADTLRQTYSEGELTLVWVEPEFQDWIRLASTDSKHPLFPKRELISSGDYKPTRLEMKRFLSQKLELFRKWTAPTYTFVYTPEGTFVEFKASKETTNND